MAALHKCRPSIAETPTNPHDPKTKVFKAGFPQRPKQSTSSDHLCGCENPVGEVVDFGNALDDLSRGEEP